MVNYYSPDTIQGMLETFKKKKEEQSSYQAPRWEQFVPQKLNTEIEDNGLYSQLQEGVLGRSRTATEIALVKAQNKANYQALLEARRRRREARRQYQSAQAPAVPPAPSGSGGGGGTPNYTGSWQDPTRLSGVGVGSNLRTVNWRGHSLTLNASAVDNFRHFLNALWRTGYHPSTIGSYAHRNIAGTNSWSTHAYGLAIDIDPSRNPVTWNGQNVTALPPGVGALAAKYGLTWGGAWNGSKRDTMHFSISPYPGGPQ